MLLLTSPSATRPPLLKGEALSKITLSNGSSKAPTPTNKKALLIGEAGGQRLLCKLDVERSETGVRLRGQRHPNTNEIPRSWASHSLAFFRLTRSKKGSTPRRLLTHRPTLPTSRRSAQDDLLKWGAVVRVVEAPTPTDLCVFDICCFDRRAVACCRRLLKYHYVLSGRSKNTPTGLIDVLLFVCRGALQFGVVAFKFYTAQAILLYKLQHRLSLLPSLRCTPTFSRGARRR